jgi:hypothetical protein
MNNIAATEAARFFSLAARAWKGPDSSLYIAGPEGPR